jgi:F-type H+-transporting ATPase subunit epsilon
VSEARLQLKVITPTRVVVDAEVEGVTLPGALGALGILPGHAPLLAALRIGELTYRAGGREHHLAIHMGFAEVTANEVMVLADIAELPEEIDVALARAEKAAAEEAMKSATSEEFDARRARLEGAITRITVGVRR